MAKKRIKKRTHVGSTKGGLPQGHAGHAVKNAAKPGSRAPRSMVIRVGASEVGHSLGQLVKDVRAMMEPDTASRLKERRSNKLRDYTSMAGPLGVTHLMLFSKSEKGNTNLRLALTPRGPTLHFRVEKYSLCKDIHQSMKRPKSGGNEYLTAPLLVMNNFASKEDESEEASKKIPKHLESLTTSIFQSLFPPINPTATPLNGIKRVLLLDRLPQDPDSDSANYILNLRHYVIETRTAKSVPKPLRRLDAAEKLSHGGQKRKRGALPNLGKLNDVSDYLLDPHAADGFTSESEPETDAEVEVTTMTQRKVQRNAKRKEGRAERGANVEKKAIKLYELGPRLKLRMTKVEEGLCNGKVMWHEYIHKTKEEIKQMEKMHDQKRQEKDRRKAEQKANVERKKAEKAARKAGGEDVEEDEDEEMDDLSDEDDDEWDDAEADLEDDEYAGPGADDEDMVDGGSDQDEAG